MSKSYNRTIATRAAKNAPKVSVKRSTKMMTNNKMKSRTTKLGKKLIIIISRITAKTFEESFKKEKARRNSFQKSREGPKRKTS